MRSKAGAVRIDDVAALAGVSIKTVSRVLNHEPHVREATRERVLTAAENLDYHPNFAARALAGSRSYLIGLFFDNPSADYVNAIELGAMAMCRQAGFHVVIEHVRSGDPGAVPALDRFLSTVRLDGVILTPPICDRAAFLETLEAHAIPYVRIGPGDDLARSPYVRIDDRQAAEAMTRYLIAHGHRRIALVQGHVEHPASAMRETGFLAAMRDAGLPVAPDYIVPGDFSFESGIVAATRLLALADPPTAIFASNDPTAVGVMSVANRLGRQIPIELSVVGFDDSPIARVVWPQLTTIRQPIVAMGEIAAGMLVRLKRENNPVDRELEFELIVRQSVGRAT